jgi:hypothetical protein
MKLGLLLVVLLPYRYPPFASATAVADVLPCFASWTSFSLRSSQPHGSLHRVGASAVLTDINAAGGIGTRAVIKDKDVPSVGR